MHGQQARLSVECTGRTGLRRHAPERTPASSRLAARGDLLSQRRRTIVFRKIGAYVLTATNVQTPEEHRLVTLGTPNTAILPWLMQAQ